MTTGAMGKRGEQLFAQRMEELGYTVQDVSGNPDYWGRDIDFLITSSTSGLTKSFEVKYDSRIHRTGNLYLELVNVHSKGEKGWFEFCEADMLAYGDAANNVFYIIPLAELKERARKLARRTAQCGNDSIGLLVSLNDIQDLIKVL